MTSGPFTLRGLRVLAPGPLTTVQDFGRTGQASLGIGRSGACDRGAHRLANALVGNHPTLATLEVTLGGLTLEAISDVVVATSGARCAGAPHLAPFRLAAGEQLQLGTPAAGLRTYLAVRGGIDVDPVLGSRATDLLAGLGPKVLERGDVLPVGSTPRPLPGVDVAPVPEPAHERMTVRVAAGPRRDWFDDDAWVLFTSQTYSVTSQSNRVGVRLEGEALHRAREGELVSEGMLRGAVQVPPSGLPVLFLADHPVTGGYPVVAYVDDQDVDRCAQLRPGQELRFSAR
ncbi:biotin-dependent carboxyltransferase family protein [Ornithinimicrobium cryptoxanthini]|uniref:Biotin-dependent carboxyltransferase family protein n=1 Tax=Ornithinimicrobium cryptoxanthini TaxID=2934161 RepID=A0ABY4YJP0_9MICO|nr:biotin-dependent carboxyltransferase family protein [Ornithinimicrobium cryptoxanthini]USQ76548.1 biotin-dependent carboxyltransferase family protein [Ornithinimicrobium cryptoxanthini]